MITVPATIFDEVSEAEFDPIEAMFAELPAGKESEPPQAIAEEPETTETPAPAPETEPPHAAYTREARLTMDNKEAHEHWLSLLAEKEKHAVGYSLEIMRLKAQLKDLRESEKAALEELEEFQQAGFIGWQNEQSGNGWETASNDIFIIRGGCPTGKTERGPSEQTNNDAWRSAPITELNFAEIKGFGKKKREALLAACPTVGEFEDIRAKFGGLTTIEGIGPILAGELENCMLDWLSKNRDKFGEAVAETVANQPENIKINAEITTETAAETAAETVAETPTTPQAETDPDEEPLYRREIPPNPLTDDEFHLLTEDEQDTAIYQRALQLQNLLVRWEITEAYGMGVDEGASGVMPYTEAAAFQTAQERDEYLAGWLAGNRQHRAENPLPRDNHPDTAEGQLALFNEIKAANNFSLLAEFLPPEKIKAYDWGCQANQNGQDFTDCDQDPGIGRINWLRGWLFASSEAVS